MLRGRRRRAAPASAIAGCHMRPVCAASWWATRTSVRRASPRGRHARDDVRPLAARQQPPQPLAAPGDRRARATRAPRASAAPSRAARRRRAARAPTAYVALVAERLDAHVGGAGLLQPAREPRRARALPRPGGVARHRRQRVDVGLDQPSFHSTGPGDQRVAAQRAAEDLAARARAQARAAPRGRCPSRTPSRAASRRGPRWRCCPWRPRAPGSRRARRSSTRSCRRRPRARRARSRAPGRACCGSAR